MPFLSELTPVHSNVGMPRNNKVKQDDLNNSEVRSNLSDSPANFTGSASMTASSSAGTFEHLGMPLESDTDEASGGYSPCSRGEQCVQRTEKSPLPPRVLSMLQMPPIGSPSPTEVTSKISNKKLQSCVDCGGCLCCCDCNNNQEEEEEVDGDNSPRKSRVSSVKLGRVEAIQIEQMLADASERKSIQQSDKSSTSLVVRKLEDVEDMPSENRLFAGEEGK